MGQFESVLSSERLRWAARFLAVLAIALAAGHLVQTLAARKAALEPAQSSLTAPANLKSPVNIVQLSSTPNEAGLTAPLLAAPVLPAAPLAASPQSVDCTPRMQLKAAPGAMVDMTVSAPCDASAPVVLKHAGLVVSERIGALGHLVLRLPALDSAGRFALRLPDGREATAALPVPELAGMKRFAIQWAGKSGFILHGMTNGAEFGGAGDISPASVSNATTGGAISLLGDASVETPLLAQIYTYPTDATLADVVVEAPVSLASCGKLMQGQTILSTEGAAQVTELTLAMPDCSAVGDFLVLKNLDQTMTLAAR
jgi:hypothetical protein